MGRAKNNDIIGKVEIGKEEVANCSRYANVSMTRRNNTACKLSYASFDCKEISYLFFHRYTAARTLVKFVKDVNKS